MTTNYVLLERIELNADTASVTFSNIPQTGYTDLKVVASARDNRSAVASDFIIGFNGVTTNLSFRRLYGDGSNAISTSGSFGSAGIEVANTATANTFSNVEITIPNYTSSNFKSYSVDSVSENNATTAYAQLTAGLWSSTAAITSITFTAESSSSFLANSTFSLYGIAAVGTTPAVAPKADGGNVIATDGTYWYHTFLASGTFTPQTALTCDYLVVAGGGGGGFSAPGGGGAGGLRCTVGATGGGGSLESALPLTSENAYTVTIGAGGAMNYAGSNSTFSTITSIGGGRGGGNAAGAPTTGGSGGGGLESGTYYAGAAGTANQGYAGGSGNGGGGGAGGAGYNGYGAGAGLPNGGVGGPGVTTSISGTSTTYASGGSAYVNNGGPQRSANPSSGGGGGASVNNGVANTGGGGAADYGSGGSGIVIIRYPVAS